eukprot:3775048-Amphidinium_carterae.1
MNPIELEPAIPRIHLAMGQLQTKCTRVKKISDVSKSIVVWSTRDFKHVTSWQQHVIDPICSSGAKQQNWTRLAFGAWLSGLWTELDAL